MTTGTKKKVNLRASVVYVFDGSELLLNANYKKNLYKHNQLFRVHLFRKRSILVKLDEKNLTLL